MFGSDITIKPALSLPECIQFILIEVLCGITGEPDDVAVIESRSFVPPLQLPNQPPDQLLLRSMRAIHRIYHYFIHSWIGWVAPGFCRVRCYSTHHFLLSVRFVFRFMRDVVYVVFDQAYSRQPSSFNLVLRTERE